MFRAEVVVCRSLVRVAQDVVRRIELLDTIAENVQGLVDRLTRLTAMDSSTSGGGAT